jgi:hypothetical protein
MADQMSDRVEALRVMHPRRGDTRQLIGKDPAVKPASE